VNSYSHEEGDGEEIDATMLAEAPMILAFIIEVVKTEDPAHFAEMWTLCGVPKRLRPLKNRTISTYWVEINEI
jgi:hypothetical protein